MNSATEQTFTEVLNRQARILHSQIAAIEREARAIGGGDELIAAMCEPYHNLLRSVYTEEYPSAQAIEESNPLLQQEQVSIVGQVREMDLDARRFELRQTESPLPGKLRCVYNEASDMEASEWLNHQVKVTGTMVSSGKEYSKLLAVDSVLVLK